MFVIDYFVNGENIMEKPINVLGRLVIIDQGNLLVVKKADWTFLPGGHVEYNEGVKDTILRECMEEFGGNVEVGELIGVLEHSFEDKNGPYHEINFVFAGKLLDMNYPQVPKSLEDDLEVIWIPLDKLEEKNLLPKEIWPMIKGEFGGKWMSTME